MCARAPKGKHKMFINRYKRYQHCALLKYYLNCSNKTTYLQYHISVNKLSTPLPTSPSPTLLSHSVPVPYRPFSKVPTVKHQTNNSKLLLYSRLGSFINDLSISFDLNYENFDIFFDNQTLYTPRQLNEEKSNNQNKS